MSTETLEKQQISPTRPLTIHKPNASGSGSAGKFNVRLVEEYGVADGKRYWKKTKGGLFVDLAKQGPQNPQGDATFGWRQEQGLITAKLGLPDLSALLVGYRAVRELGKQVPVELRPQVRESDDDTARQRKALTVSMFHKAQGRAGGTSTAITYEFTANGGTLRVSKSKELARTLNVSLAEEYRLFKFFDSGLGALMKLGAR